LQPSHRSGDNSKNRFSTAPNGTDNVKKKKGPRPEEKRNQQQQKIALIGAAIAPRHRCVAENATVPVKRPVETAQIAVSKPNVRTTTNTITTTRIPRIPNRQHNPVTRSSRAIAEARMIIRRTIQRI